jgi:hypothetical protein
MRPPRALWVPFELGRPLGVPGDAAFQLDVLRSLLGLLERTELPVHEDYPHDAPAAGDAGMEGWACPVPVAATESDGGLQRLLRDEIALLRPWHEESARTRGRTSVGVSGLGAAAIEEIGDTLASFAEGDPVATPAGATVPLPRLARFLADDAKAFYQEAVAAQPGRVAATSEELGRWLYGESILGRVLFELRDRVRDSEDPEERALRGALIPGKFLRVRASQP